MRDGRQAAASSFQRQRGGEPEHDSLGQWGFRVSVTGPPHNSAMEPPSPVESFFWATQGEVVAR
jgi:hypothetical protein